MPPPEFRRLIVTSPRRCHHESQRNLKQEENVHDNLLNPHSIRPMPLQLLHRRPHPPQLRVLLQSPNEIAEPQIILDLKVLCALLSDDSAAPAPKRSRTANLVIETIIQEEASQPRVVETSFDLPIVRPPAPPPVGTRSPENYEYEDYAREVSISVFDAENQI